MKQISPRLGKINTYYRNLWFDEPDANHLKILMRTAFENKEKFEDKKKHTRDDIEKFSYENITQIALSRLKEIEEEICV